MQFMRSRLATVFAVALVALTGYFLLRHTAQADDSTHTTSLGTATENFDGSAETAVKGAFASTDNADARLKVTLFLKPYGMVQESARAYTETTRTANGLLSISSAISYAELGSGDQVRAQFESFDSGGSPAFSYSRTYTKP